MTQPNTSKNLDEILTKYGYFLPTAYEDEEGNLATYDIDQVKQEILKHFKALISESKPEKKMTHLKKCYTDQFKCLCGADGFNSAIDQFEANLLRELGIE